MSHESVANKSLSRLRAIGQPDCSESFDATVVVEAWPRLPLLNLVVDHACLHSKHKQGIFTP